MPIFPTLKPLLLGSSSLLMVFLFGCSPANDEITIELVNVAKTGQCHQKVIFKNSTNHNVTLAGRISYAEGYHAEIETLNLNPNSTERLQYNILEAGASGAEIFNCNKDVLNPQPKVEVSQCDIENGTEEESMELVRHL